MITDLPWDWDADQYAFPLGPGNRLPFNEGWLVKK